MTKMLCMGLVLLVVGCNSIPSVCSCDGARMSTYSTSGFMEEREVNACATACRANMPVHGCASPLTKAECELLCSQVQGSFVGCVNKCMF